MCERDTTPGQVLKWINKQLFRESLEKNAVIIEYIF